MEISRYILTQAVKTRDNKLIPLWDPAVKFIDSENYGNMLYVETEFPREIYSVVECIFDIETKILSPGIDLDYYPECTQFIADEIVYVDLKSNRKLTEDKVIKIIYEEYDLIIKRGLEFDRHELEKFKDINSSCLYAIRQWKPIYLLESGEKIKWSYQIYKKS